MKIFSVFSLIALVHIAVIGTLLVQPGCQNKPAETPDPSSTRVGAQTSPVRELSQPEQTSTSVDSAFNAGLTDNRGTTSKNLSEPMRPVVDTRLTNQIDDAVLEPVLNPVSESQGGGDGNTYKVRSGDSLSKIARNQGVSLVELMQANNMNKNSTIYVGQSLFIPNAKVDRVEVDSSEIETSNYTVRSGDNLSLIAKKNGVTVAMLKSVNGLRNDTIFVGQELMIPLVSSSGSRTTLSQNNQESSANNTRPVSTSGASYTVQKGDTPSGIARKFGVTSQSLMSANGISDPRKLFVGQSLTIPGVSASRVANNSTTVTTQKPTATRTTNTSSTPKPLVVSSSQPTGSNTGSTPISNQEDPMLLLEALEEDDLPFSEVEEINDESGAEPSN